MESKSNRLLNLATKKQIIRSKDVFALGIPRNYLAQACSEGRSQKGGTRPLCFELRPPSLSICR